MRYFRFEKVKYNCVTLAPEEIITYFSSISQISSIILISQYRSKVLLFSLKSVTWTGNELEADDVETNYENTQSSPTNLSHLL